MLINNDVDIRVILLILSWKDEEWVIKGDDPYGEYVHILSGLEHKVSPTIQEILEFFSGGPSYSDLWISRNELISDVLEDDPDLGGEIYDDNMAWFAEARKEAYDKLFVFEIIPGVSLKALYPIMKKRGVI